MADFEYKDKDGENEYRIEASIDVHSNSGTVVIGVYESDHDGNNYHVYVPNHRAEILNLIAELQGVLDKTADWPKGYDGFSFGHASAESSGIPTSFGEAGVVKHY